MKKINLGVIGVTGMVGNTFLDVLENRNIPVENYYFFASAKSAGKKITFKGKEYTVIELTHDIINYKLDVAVLSAGSNVSKEYCPLLAKSGCIAVDNSSHFRMHKDVPLVVPEVNKEDIKLNKGIIANPNCSTIQAMVALKPLDDKYKIKRIVYSTYQAVSGSGVKGCRDLEEGLKGNPPTNYPYAIANNCLPHIDDFIESGYTKEEMKMILETKKILHNDNLRITATTVRVPVFDCHSESINVEFYNDFELLELVDTLKNAEGVVVQNDSKNLNYPMAITAKGTDEVYVGRIRRDYSVASGVNLWVVADNIRKGAATNAIQIVEEILKNM